MKKKKQKHTDRLLGFSAILSVALALSAFGYTQMLLGQISPSQTPSFTQLFVMPPRSAPSLPSAGTYRNCYNTSDLESINALFGVTGPQTRVYDRDRNGTLDSQDYAAIGNLVCAGTPATSVKAANPKTCFTLDDVTAAGYYMGKNVPSIWDVVAPTGSVDFADLVAIGPMRCAAFASSSSSVGISIPSSFNPVSTNNNPTGLLVADPFSCTVSGYAKDPNSSEALSVQVYLLSPTGSVIYSENVTASVPYLGQGNHGFVVQIPIAFRTMENQAFGAYARNVGPGAQTILNQVTMRCFSVFSTTSYSSINAGINNDPTGILVPVPESCELKAFVRDPNSTAPVALQVFTKNSAGEVEFTNISASYSPQDGQGGLRLQLPSRFKDGVTRTYGAYAVNIGPGASVYLNPFSMTCSPVASSVSSSSVTTSVVSSSPVASSSSSVAASNLQVSSNVVYSYTVANNNSALVPQGSQVYTMNVSVKNNGSTAISSAYINLASLVYFSSETPPIEYPTGQLLFFAVPGSNHPHCSSGTPNNHVARCSVTNVQAGETKSFSINFSVSPQPAGDTRCRHLITKAFFEVPSGPYGTTSLPSVYLSKPLLCSSAVTSSISSSAQSSVAVSSSSTATTCYNYQGSTPEIGYCCFVQQLCNVNTTPCTPFQQSQCQGNNRTQCSQYNANPTAFPGGSKFYAAADPVVNQCRSAHACTPNACAANSQLCGTVCPTAEAFGRFYDCLAKERSPSMVLCAVSSSGASSSVASFQSSSGISSAASSAASNAVLQSQDTIPCGGVQGVRDAIIDGKIRFKKYTVNGEDRGFIVITKDFPCASPLPMTVASHKYTNNDLNTQTLHTMSMVMVPANTSGYAVSTELPPKVNNCRGKYTLNLLIGTYHSLPQGTPIQTFIQRLQWVLTGISGYATGASC